MSSSSSNPPASSTAMVGGGNNGSAANPPMPAVATLLNAAKLGMAKDMPIQLDYFTDSYNGKAFLGEDVQTKEKMLVKDNAEEFTSHIQKIYKAGEDYIIMTENSIYVVSGKIQKRQIEAASLRENGGLT